MPKDQSFLYIAMKEVRSISREFFGLKFRMFRNEIDINFSAARWVVLGICRLSVSAPPFPVCAPPSSGVIPGTTPGSYPASIFGQSSKSHTKWIFLLKKIIHSVIHSNSCYSVRDICRNKALIDCKTCIFDEVISRISY